MATRMQQRRGTAAQWISTNAGAGPVLNAGEIGWESDTNKFKIGDGVNNWTSLDYFADINSTVNPAFGTSITFEGATADSYETVLQVTDPTADRTITLPNVTGTVITTGNLSDITDIGVFTSTIVMEGSTADAHELTISAGDPTADRTATFPDATGTICLDTATQTLTNKTIAFGSNTVSGTLAEFNTAVTDADLASIAGTETLTNKTLTSPVISGLTLSDSSIVIEGSTANDFETTLTVTDPTADRTITFPDSTGTVALTSDITVTASSTNTFSNKSISLATNTVTGTTAEFNTALSDSNFVTTGDTGTVTSTMIADGTITNDDINASAAIAASKISGTAITAADTGTVTSTMIADGTIVNGDINASAAIAQSKIADLTTDLAAKAPLAAPALTGDATAVNLTISGNLTVNGTTTNINSTNLVVEDKNIVLADVETPTDTTADGGGITLKGATDKTFNWVDATDAWTSSEHINLASGKSLYLNGTLLKDVSETLTNKTLTTPVISSISNTGTLTLPTDTDTLVGRATTDTLTNKTLGSAVATTAFTLNATAELRLADTDSSHYVGFKAPGTVSTNRIWTLPSADGTANQVLQTDGSGVLSFATASAGVDEAIIIMGAY